MWLKLLIVFSIAAACSASLTSPRWHSHDVEDFSETDLVTPAVDPFDGISYRLPNTTVPLLYDVFLSTEIHRGEFGFDGRVMIRFRCVENTNELVLQFRQMTISDVTLFDASNQLIQQNVPWYQNHTVEFLVITPTQPLVAGIEYSVGVVYNGTIRTGGLGWYRSSYLNEAGQRVWLSSTQFQANEARHAFPCYDEPARRSRFRIAIRHHQSYRALSNMPVRFITNEVGTNFVTTTFKETPSMQTYLVAFTVSDFIFIENSTVVPPQRIYGRRQAMLNGEGQMALEASIKIMAEFERYVNIPYTFPKMDQFACPDFVFGAMENWGLVLYFERFLLFNPATDRVRDHEWVVVIVSHEFAHQWFGNLVSPEWWTFLWINEGFATLYEFYMTHLVYPEEQFMDNFFVSYQRVAMENDANPNVRAMSKYVENPNRIVALFDVVAYHKAGSVFYMFQQGLGENTWAKGLNYFLIDRMYNYTNAGHLYAGLQRAVNEDFPNNPVDVALAMTTWEMQPGIPVITVVRSGNQLFVNQERFFYGKYESSNVWRIPVNYVVGSNPNFRSTAPDFWFNQRSIILNNATAPKPWGAHDWLIFNIQTTGYYRVNYDYLNWVYLSNQLNGPGNSYQAIHVLNRGQLVDDSFHLARAGKITFDVMLRIMDYLEREMEYVPWALMQRANILLNRWLLGTPVYSYYQEMMRKNVEANYNRLGVTIITGEKRVDRYLREITMDLACQANSQRCLTETAQQLQNFATTGIPLAADVMQSIYCNGARRATRATITFMQNLLQSTTFQRDRNFIIAGLGCIGDPHMLRDHLLMALRPGSNLSTAERTNMLNSPLNHGESSLQVLMDFVRLNYGGIALINPNLVATICSNIAARISTEAAFAEFDSLMVHLELNGALSSAQRNNFMVSARGILSWQHDHLRYFLRFFDRE